MKNRSRQKQWRVDTSVDTLPGSLFRNTTTGRWYWRVQLPGEAKRRAIPLRPKGAEFATRTKRVAVVLQKRLFRKYFVDQTQHLPQHIDDWLPGFEAWNAITASERTVKNNVRIVKACLGGCTLDDVNADHIQAYLIELAKTASPATTRKHRNAIGKFCRFLNTKCPLNGNPATQTESPRIYSPPPRYLDEHQVRALRCAMRSAPVWLRAAVTLALDTGLRLHELLALRWRDVRDGQIVVGTETPNKVGQWRVLPLSRVGVAALGLLGRAADKALIFPQAKKFASAQYVKALRAVTKPLPVFGELEGKRTGNQWHLLRSTWACRRARAGMDIWELMRRGGWKTLQTVLRYVNIGRAAGGA